MTAFKVLVALGLPVAFVIVVFNIMPPAFAVLTTLALGFIAFKVALGFIAALRASRHIKR